MRCPKCGFTGFDHLPTCKKCAYPLRDNTGEAAREPALRPAAAKTPPAPPQKVPTRVVIPGKVVQHPLPAAGAPVIPARQPTFAAAAPTAPPLLDLPALPALTEPLPPGKTAEPPPATEDILPPLPTITIAAAQPGHGALPRQALSFDLRSFGSSPDNATPLPPLDDRPPSDHPFINLPVLQEIPARPVFEPPPISSATTTGNAEVVMASLPPERELPAPPPGSAENRSAPATLPKAAMRHSPSTALAIDLLLLAGLFLLLVWMTERILSGGHGAQRSFAYTLLLAGMHVGYFALFRRPGRQTPGAGLLKRFFAGR